MDAKKLSELIRRLEHISADSIWAHRASGVRRSLVRWQEKLHSGEEMDAVQSRALLEAAYRILEEAAKEIPPDEP